MYSFVEREIRQAIQVDADVLRTIEDGFSKLAAGECIMPPIMRVDIEESHGEVDVKTAYIPGYEYFAIKLSSGFFENVRLGLPSGNGMMLLMSTKTGFPEAILLDHGYLTDVRTAAAGAIASHYLAKNKVDTVGVIGAGSQARHQILALQQVRNFRRLLVFAPTTNRVAQFVKEMQPKLQREITVAESAEQVVRESDLVVTATPATKPIIQADWLHSGIHITAMGSDAEHKQELAPAVLQRADHLVCDAKEQCFRLGELHHGLYTGVLSKADPITELGEITAGWKTGRRSDEEITICDLTGTGVQDTMIALFAYKRLRRLGLGRLIGSEGR